MSRTRPYPGATETKNTPEVVEGGQERYPGSTKFTPESIQAVSNCPTYTQPRLTTNLNVLETASPLGI
ncbi:hypothetical protein NEOLEDRAFT_128089 [Neolentinus lepideus HHB14362 ss-1]|uniref:Uncharacterized protein n=1 Tax=Neolentinus lepideus HHB14362 ss-1 TaxID=1314782 RepID=A0A165MQP3_9AGAM|nr:hypothetical protein NEOLEDRAFT_128089 [Neolentinus lepideus HHB14362 ss-1]